MARKMRRVDTGTVVNVYSYATNQMFWEYYFLDPKPDSQKNMRAIVLGFETDMGDVHIPEIQPYLMSFTRDVSALMPAPGWEWVD
jgi:hypothetical protein